MSRGHDVVPCETPHFTLFQDEFIKFNSTLCFLFPRYDLKQNRYVPRIPHNSNINIKMSCFIVSKAFLRSRKKLIMF